MTQERSFTPLDGGCRCGRLRFRMETKPIITHCCHCRTCQKNSGAAFRINAMIETDKLSLLEGAPESFLEPSGHVTIYCPDCRTGLWSHIPHFGAAMAFVAVGALDSGETLPPEAHYFTRSKHPWIALPDGVPAFEGLAHPAKLEAKARIAAVLARTGNL